MSIAFAKIRGDLRYRPGRAILKTVAVLIGTAAVAASLIAVTVLDRAIPESFTSSLPPDAIFVTGDQTAAALSLLSGTSGVIAAEPRRVLRGRIATANGAFATLSLTVVPDLRTQSVSRIETGAPAGKGLLIERSSLAVWGKVIGDTAMLRLPGTGQITLPTSGLTADAAVAPGVQDRIVYAYATPEMVGALGIFDEIRVRIDPGTLTALLARLDAAGIVPSRVEEPLQRHPHADQMQAVMVLLSVFAIAALAVAAALVGNLVAVSLRAEGRLIGIQKSIGATSARVVWTTLAGVAVVAVPAALAGVALGGIAAAQFLAFAAHELNLADQSLSASAEVLAVAFALGTLAPLTATFVIAWRAARVAPLAAISADRTTAPPKRAPRGKATSVARAYAMRHIGRAPLRLALMLLALSLGGAAVLSAGTVYRSLSAAVDRVFAYRSDDLDLRLLTPAPADALAAAAAATDGITRAEVWGFLLTAIADTDRRITGTRFGLLAPPEKSRLLHFPVAEGRWLGDPAAAEVVVARSLLARYPQLSVGSEFTLARGDRRVKARIVGAVEEATEPGMFATQSLHDALAGGPGLAGTLRLTTTQAPATVAARLEERLFGEGLVPIFSFVRAELQQATTAHFVILLVLLSTVGGASVIIGGLALWSSISISILERRREIAVLRSLGTSNATVLRLFAMESAGLAVLALVLSVVIALPLSAALAAMLGQGAIFIGVSLHFSWVALVIWLFVLSAIVALATWRPISRALALPAARALRYG